MRNCQKISKEEQDHIVKLLKQKFVSPYKLIYMIDQQQADHFKSRNLPQQNCTSEHSHHNQTSKSANNCSCTMLSTMHIPYNQQTKLEKLVTDQIINIPNYLNEILEFCEDRFQNVINSGRKDQLKVTTEVEKYIMDKVMFESAHNILYGKITEKLVSRISSTNTDIGLWATPATWKAKYPDIPLTIFKGQHLSRLHEDGYLTIKFMQKESLHEHDDLGRSLNTAKLFSELQLLQKDGKFEQLEANDSSQAKTFVEIEKYAAIQAGKYFPQLNNMLMIAQSLPFELNMKKNEYMTLNEQIQIVFFYRKKQVEGESELFRKILESTANGQSAHKYYCLMCIGMKCQLQLQSKKQGNIINLVINSGDLLLVTSSKHSLKIKSHQSLKAGRGFILQSKLFTATKY